MSTTAPLLLLDINFPTEPPCGPIATLGPEGTSSEASAAVLGTQLGARFDRPASDWPVHLYEQYEQAAKALHTNTASLLVVANAYHGVSEFYMDLRLQLLGAYVRDTPLYGIAAAPSSPRTGSVRIASHPAPVPLINQLLDPHFDVAEIVRVDSTSLAAAAAASGAVDLALTTEPASNLHGLTLVSDVRPIRMLWSIFARRTSKTGEEPVWTPSR